MESGFLLWRGDLGKDQNWILRGDTGVEEKEEFSLILQVKKASKMSRK